MEMLLLSLQKGDFKVTLSVFWKRELWDSDRGSFFPLIVEKECGYCLG